MAAHQGRHLGGAGVGNPPPPKSLIASLKVLLGPQRPHKIFFPLDYTFIALVVAKNASRIAHFQEFSEMSPLLFTHKKVRAGQLLCQNNFHKIRGLCLNINGKFCLSCRVTETSLIRVTLALHITVIPFGMRLIPGLKMCSSGARTSSFGICVRMRREQLKSQIVK